MFLLRPSSRGKFSGAILPSVVQMDVDSPDLNESLVGWVSTSWMAKHGETPDHHFEGKAERVAIFQQKTDYYSEDFVFGGCPHFSSFKGNLPQQ